MSKVSISAKIEFILQMISNIETIIQRHGNITNALEDIVEAKPAILMALMQIGESLKKIDDDILKKYELLNEKKGAYSVRNFIAHDYDGVDLGLIDAIIRENLPSLKEKMQKLQKEYSLDDKNSK